MITSSERVRELLNYDADTGVFTRRIPANNMKVGVVAGSYESRGYLRIMIDGRYYKAHRIAWLWMTGGWPAAEIDHVNHDRSDNRWANLRQATRSQNMWNTRVRSNNTSGFKGVYLHRRSGKWAAAIRIDGSKRWLGSFSTPEAAAAAYATAAADFFGDFARMN